MKCPHCGKEYDGQTPLCAECHDNPMACGQHAEDDPENCCQVCGAAMDFERASMENGFFLCPACEERTDFARCPYCENIWWLEYADFEYGAYECRNCGRSVDVPRPAFPVTGPTFNPSEQIAWGSDGPIPCPVCSTLSGPQLAVLQDGHFYCYRCGERIASDPAAIPDEIRPADSTRETESDAAKPEPIEEQSFYLGTTRLQRMKVLSLFLLLAASPLIFSFIIRTFSASAAAIAAAMYLGLGLVILLLRHPQQRLVLTESSLRWEHDYRVEEFRVEDLEDAYADADRYRGMEPFDAHPAQFHLVFKDGKRLTLLEEWPQNDIRTALTARLEILDRPSRLAAAVRPAKNA